jgi:para-nitrobenzyl esterase
LADLLMIPSADLVRTMGSNAIGFGLRPNVDGLVLPHDLPDVIAREANGAALLIGSNYDEGTELLPMATRESLTAYQLRRFGADGDAVAKLYNGTDTESANIAQDRMLSDYAFAASTREAEIFSKNGAPTYVYRFTRFAPGSEPTKVGAFHSAELVYVFGTQASADRPWSERDRELSDQMQRYWTNFAKTGDPNGAGLPKWPRYGTSEKDVMELGDATGPIGVLEPERRSAFDAYLSKRLSQ